MSMSAGSGAMTSGWVARTRVGLPFGLVLLFALVSGLGDVAKSEPPAPVKPAPTFAEFVESLWPPASARGVSRATFDAAVRGLTFNPRVVALSGDQPEFTIPIWRYLDSAVSPSRIERGRAAAERQHMWLVKARLEYGVDAATIMGIWGMETEFGAFSGSDNVIQSLASLAFSGYHADYFRAELVSALVILQEGDIGAKAMVGSWAGAMGQTQFMPSSFLDYAVDFDGRGRRDIWNDPADAIGSTAHYLAKHGWKPGLPWGFEVRLPPGFKLAALDFSTPAEFARFVARGVERADGAAMPSSGEAKILIPAGVKGPIFLVTSNFAVIRSYNNSVSYALGVALLGDAIMGGKGLRANWPIRDRPLTSAQTRDLQTCLKSLGYEIGEIDGRVGERLEAAVREYEDARGLIPDGYVTTVRCRGAEGGR
jgi:lytic murein transglycosylase